MPTTSYIPTRIADFNTWVVNFQTYVDANYVALGLSTLDLATIDDAVNQFTAAYALSSVNDTRTPATIADTTTKRNYCRDVLQQYSQIINNSAATSDAQRAALQITIRATGKTPIPTPLSYPVITIVNATPLVHTMRVQDSQVVLTKVKAKPFGASAMELRQHVGATAPASPDDADFIGLFSRWPFQINQDPAHVGQTAYYYGRWITARGLTGPWSAVATMTVAG